MRTKASVVATLGLFYQKKKMPSFGFGRRDLVSLPHPTIVPFLNLRTVKLLSWKREKEHDARNIGPFQSVNLFNLWFATIDRGGKTQFALNFVERIWREDITTQGVARGESWGVRDPPL